MNRTALIALILGLCNLARGQANGFCNLVWNDEFEGTTLSSKWQKEATCYGGGNNEMECYTTRDKNVFLDNGNLVLRAYRETYTGSQNGCTDNQGCTYTKPYTSGRVNTANSASWLYGRFETRAKLPSGIQLWPAIWMLPTDWKYGGWAASGEIDIMESRGNNPSLVSGTLHHGGQWPQNIWTTTGDHGLGVDLSQDFHVYTLEWTKDSLTWYIDNVQTQQVTLHQWFNSTAPNVYSAQGQPFDQRFHFILNLAVGGGFFGNDAPVTDAQSAAWISPEMRVDYVRVYQQGGNCPTSSSKPAAQSTQAADAGARPTSSSSSAARPTSTSTANAVAQAATCNGQNYDARGYTCTINEAGRQILCGAGMSSCGAACFNPLQYCCNNGNLLAKAVCPLVTPNRATSASTTSTTTSAAPSTSAANNQAANNCNGQSFDSRVYDCTTNDQGHNILCSKGSMSCGNACYDKNAYCCKNGGLAPKSQC